MEPIKLEIFIDDKSRAGIQSATGNIGTLEKQMQQVINILEQDLKGLQQAFKETLSQNVSEPKAMAEIQVLTGEVNKLKEALKKLKKQKEETNGVPVVDDKVFVGMDDIAKKTNNLKMQFTQVARELPALAMGPQMFILAISNNLPMLTEAIANVRKQNELLRASGQKGVPVWKQLGGAMFSWQTGLIVVITLLITYGKELTEWTKKAFRAKEAALSVKEIQEKVNKAFNEASGEAAKQITSVQSLSERWKALGDNMKEKKEFVTKNKKEFDKLGVSINNVDDAENLLITNTSSYIEAMTLRAEAAAAFKLATEENEKALKKQREAEQKKQNGPTFWNKFKSAMLATAPGTVVPTPIKDAPTAEQIHEHDIQALNEEAEAAENTAKSYIALQNEKLKAAAEKLKGGRIKEKEDEKGKGTGKSALDYQNELADARVRAQQKVEAARIAVMQDGYKKRQALARKELDEELARIDKEERDTLLKMQEAKKKGVKITPEEEKQVSTVANLQRALATDKYIKDYYKAEKDWQDKNIQSWIDYNKEYGTWQEKRLAITREYNMKMLQEGLTEGERAKLGKDLQAELRELNMEQFKDSINFADVFGDLDAQSTEALAILRDKLKEFINNSAKDLKPDDLKSLQDAFKDIDFEIKDRKPFRELKKDLNEYRSAQAEVEKAQTELNQVVKFGSLLIEEYDEETGEVTRRLLTQEQAEKNLTAAQEKRKKAMSGLIKSMSGVSAEIGNISNAANSIISTFDMIGIEVGEDVRGVVEGFSAMSEGISNVVSAAQNGDIAGVIAGTVGAVGGAIKTLGSLFGADWGGEKSRRRYEEAKEKYESYMDVLDQVINKQKDLVASMEADDFANADNSYEKARDLLKKQQDYAREMGKAYLNSGASKGFMGIGSSSSEGVKQRKSISASAWEQARKVLGSDFGKVSDGRMTGLFDLSYEKLVKLRDEATGFWGELKEDTRTYLNQIIESEEAWQEVQKARKEALTKVDFDSFYDSFVSALANMDSTSEDFAKNFEKYLQNAIFSALVAGQYKERIENLYSSWADMAQSDKKLTDTEADDLRKQYNQIVNEMLAEREQIMKDFGWSASASSSSQSGRAGAVTSITEETGGKIEGSLNVMTDYMIDISRLIEELKKGRETDSAVFAEIAANTAYCKMLEPLLDIMQRWESNSFKITM